MVAAYVICPHCGAEDRYDLSGWQYIIVTLTMLWMRWVTPGPEDWFQAIRMGSRDGRIMHPLEMLYWYEEQGAAHPRNADLRLHYANTLRTLGRMDAAIEEYRQTLALAPKQPEALINLAALLAQRGESEAALAHLRTLAAIKPKNREQSETVSIANEVLAGTLSLEELEIGNPLYKVRD